MASFMPSPVQIIRIRREDTGLCRGTLPCRGVPLPEPTPQGLALDTDHVSYGLKAMPFGFQGKGIIESGFTP